MRFVDLTGQRFGRLTVLSRAEDHILPSGYKEIMWNCKCDCGNVVTINGHNIRSGHTKSCGCLKVTPYEDLTGKKYNNLTVISRLDDIPNLSGSKSRRWLCRCVCGKEVECVEDRLISGRIIGCGCSASESKKTTYLKNIDKINKYVEHDDYTSLFILPTNSEVLIDKEDAEICKKYGWHLNKEGYVISSFGCYKTDRHRIYLHNYIMESIHLGKYDHANGNRLDNRKQNLRLCTQQQNAINRIPIKNKHPGVGFDKKRNKWYVAIGEHGKTHYVGRYNTEREAVEARIAAEEKYHGEFGYYNSRIKPNVKNKEEYLNGFSETNSKRN